jgi:hypothetical protein
MIFIDLTLKCFSVTHDQKIRVSSYEDVCMRALAHRLCPYSGLLRLLPRRKIPLPFMVTSFYFNF